MRILKKIAGIYLVFLIQSLFFENIKIFSCSPDLFVTAIIIAAVSEDFLPASMLGAFAGLLIDVLFGEAFGIYILLYMYLALFVSLAADKKNLNSPLIMSWVCFVSVAAMEIVISLFKTGIGRNLSPGTVCANVFVKGFFAALVSMGFVLLLIKLEERRKKKVVNTDSLKEVCE